MSYLRFRASVWANIVLLVVSLTGFAGVAWAQATAGSLRGVVTDQTGSVIPSADVMATNLSTGQQLATQTTEAGVFVLGNVPVGDYELAVESIGFKRHTQQPVNVGTASTTSINVTLQVGEVTESVTVEGSFTPLMQTDNSEVSTVMERKMVIDLPLDLGGRTATAGASGRRQIEAFIYLTPGITGDQWNKHFLGSPMHSSQAVVDGIPHALQESPGLTGRTSPPFEAVEEFKVATTMYPADTGRGFGVVNYTMKSGTNEWHGNAFWFVRNDKLDASGFFNDERPIVRQNEFGGTIGGPILKNKLFVAGAYQGFRRRGGATSRGTQTIPTAAFRNGDFSELRTPAGAQIPIFDPRSNRPDGQGGIVRDPFPNNIIPGSQISRVAADVMSAMPEPDRPGIVDNWNDRSKIPTDDDVYSTKVDYNVSEKHRVSFSMWRVDLGQNRFAAWGEDSILDTGFGTFFTGGGYRVNYDFTVRPTLLNHFAWGYSNSDKDRIGNFESPGNVFNIPNIPTDVEQVSSFQVPGYLAIGNAGGGPDITKDSANIFTDTVTWIKGRHNIKFGGEFWSQRFSRFDGRQAAGIFQFNRQSTSQPNSPNFSNWGDSVASMLVGDVFSSERLVNPIDAIYDTNYLAFFAEDKFQVSQKLTLSLGLRYDLPWSIKERNENISAIDFNLANPNAGGLPGAYVFGNDRIRPDLDTTQWAPRLAMAYRWNEKTVIRAGFGLIYAQTNALVSGMELGGSSLLAGFFDRSNPRSLDQGITPAYSLDDGPPPFEGTLPNLDPGIKVGDVADWIDPDGGKAAYTTNFNFTIQRELPFGLFTDLAYVGAKGTNLPSKLDNPNQVGTEYLGLGSLLNANINSPGAIEAGFTSPYPGFNGTVSQSLRRFPQYTNLVIHASPVGNHTYHSFQAKVQKRFSHGLSFLVAYTLSKTISDTQGNAWANIESAARDTGNRGLEKAVAPFDQGHNLSVNFVYELPGSTLTGAKGALLKGWQLSGSVLYQNGVPLSISGGPSLPLFNGGNRPNRVSGVDRFTGVSKGDFDPAQDLLLNINAFSQPAPFTYGDVSRTEPDLRGFSFWNESLSLVKRTYIREQMNVEFRAEFFSIFNRVVFTNPASNANNAQSFGRVSGQANTPRTIQFALKFNF